MTIVLASDKTIHARFWPKVDRRGPNECWPWLGNKVTRGYGHILFNGKYQRAHRVSFLLHGGAIPNGHFVCHRCDNPSCVNPAHLFVGTPKDNAQDCLAKGRRAPVPTGIDSPVAKLNAEQRARAVALALAGFSIRKIGRLFGVHPMTIKRAIARPAA